jgi:hypothetical protein
VCRCQARITTGQDGASRVGYAPLGKDLQSKAIAQVKAITLNGSPVAS